ncbi:MAG TPA: hypothetical protein PK725_15845 [Rhodocyclaceae bacterium]|uniref:hypothetical protein n=1 Tax=Thauera sp. TaxID=1905334 RepID=UPI002CEE7765|nr:hypothetical protein [Thauera sp.]HRP26574.1 hypothetical protein [Thauera sp.]HRQ48427.1 hypothetical protein [Rhodocyclaceae bacterium]
MTAADRKSGAKSDGRDNKGRFAKGNAGKPRGCRHNATMLARTLLEDGIEDAVNTILAAAPQGDVQAATRVVIDRQIPAVKERPLSLPELPDITSAAGVADAQAVALRSLASSDLLPSEAATLASVIENRRRAIETLDLEARIASLEGPMPRPHKRMSVLERLASTSRIPTVADLEGANAALAQKDGLTVADTIARHGSRGAFCW